MTLNEPLPWTELNWTLLENSSHEAKERKPCFQGHTTHSTLNISQTATDTAIVTTEGEQETAPKLSNGTSLNDLAWPLSQISMSRYYST